MRPRVRRRQTVPDDGHVARITGLTVDFSDGGAWTNVLQDITLAIRAGTSVGLVGESGCGKTTTAYALMGYRRPGSRIRGGSVQVLGRELIGASWGELGRVRGGEVGFVPQNPTVALNPRLRVGEQIDETLRFHRVGGSQAERRERIGQLLDQVGLPGGRRVAEAFPHQLSGGQQQRVMIALALACDPQLVVLDEPTTGLDVTTQAQILDLLNELRTTVGMAMLYVTHDLGVVAEVCDRVCVMYAGHVVEEGSRGQIFDSPRHPYTKGLISAVPSAQDGPGHAPKPLKGILQRHLLPAGCRFAPRCEYATERCFAEQQQLATIAPGHRVACWRQDEIPAHALAPAPSRSAPRRADGALLEVTGLDCTYARRRRSGAVPLVVRDVGLTIAGGETLALVGESGSGKSTIARALAGVLTPVAGELRIDGQPIPWKARQRSRLALRSTQLVLQNPDASLNPRRRIGQIIARPLEFYGLLEGRRLAQRVEEILQDVRLDARFARRFPSELSGGERQRVALARALASEPTLVLCDEILSALDVSVQAEILDLMRRLQMRDGTAYLFISHDLNVVRSLAHRVAVLYRGELCEVGLTDEVYQPPFHPYTSILLASVPGAKRETRKRVRARHDEARSERQGCPLAATCPHKVGHVCEKEPPPWRQVSDTHVIRCHATLEELRGFAAAVVPAQPADIPIPVSDDSPAGDAV